MKTRSDALNAWPGLDHDKELPITTSAEASALKAKLRARAGKGASHGKANREPVTSVAKVESDRARKNSRVKGSRAELDVAAMFSRWCGEEVRRTPLSGGWSSAKFGVTADLVCANPAFNFHVEIKHRESWVLDDLVTGVRKDHDKSIVQWWKQCVESCPKQEDKANRIDNRGRVTLLKEPLLVFRRNRQPWLVMMRADSVSNQMRTSDPCIRHALTNARPARFTLPYDTMPDVAVMLLDVFLDLEPVPKGLKNHKVET